MADDNTPDTETTEPAAEEGAERIAALEAEIAELKDRMLRTLAEMENLRRRSEREMADARQYAVANFARDVLTVGDNLRRALDAVPAEQRTEAGTALTALLEGVEVTERGLAQTLQKFGIRAVEPKGEKFDPAKHQAMFEVERTDLPAGTVAEVIQIGYTIGERILRPALVGVAKGGPRQPQAKPAASESQGKAEADTGKTPEETAEETQPAGDGADRAS